MSPAPRNPFTGASTAPRQFQWSSSPLRVAVAYGLFAFVCVWGVDLGQYLAGIHSAAALIREAVEGSAFVLLSTLFIYWATQRELAKSSRVTELLKAVVEGTTSSIFVKDLEGKYLLCNQSGAEIIGKSISEILGRDDLATFEPETAQRLIAVDRQILESGESITREETISRGGVARIYLSTKAPYRDSSGKIVGVLGIAHDITERKAVEQRLEQSEMRFRAFMQYLPGVAWIKDEFGKYIFVSDATLLTFGRNREEVIGRRDVEFLPPETARQFQTHDGLVLQTELPGVFFERLRHPDGSLHRYVSSKFLIPLGSDRPIVGGAAIDITERLETEEALRLSELRLRLALTAARMGIWDWDITADKIYWSQECHAISGAATPPDCFDDLRRIIHPDDVEAVFAHVDEVKKSRQPVQTEFRAIGDDGRIRWIACSGRMEYASDGRPLRMIGVAQEITERKEAERKLVVQRALLDQVSDSIEIVDPATGRYLDINERACAAHGYTREEFLSLHATDLNPPIAARGWENVSRMIREAKSTIFESTHRRKDGEEFPVEINVTHARFDREYFLTVVRDVTERKKLEAQFRHSQKMEAVGRLAGGVAHDFNNLLTVISGYGGVLYEQIPPGEAQNAVLGILDAGSRASRLTRQLLMFGRKAPFEPKILDPSELVADSVDLLRRLIGEDIQLEVLTDSAAPHIKADPSQMEQVILNLVVNAREAMPAGGKLTIECLGRQIAENDPLCAAGLKPGEYAQLAVTDTGRGIPAEIRSQIFEPFFTTKAAGGGSGLGLSVVHGIINQCGGYLDVRSEAGKGASFVILFPAATGELQRRDDPKIESPASGQETILLVEDEDAVRNIARLSLEMHGYQVIEAANGLQALRIMERRERPIDLLLTDVVMPEVGGRRLVDELRGSHPTMKVLFMSGYSDESLFPTGHEDAAINFIQKPFTPRELALKVRSVIDQG